MGLNTTRETLPVSNILPVLPTSLYTVLRLLDNGHPLDYCSHWPRSNYLHYLLRKAHIFLLILSTSFSLYHFHFHPRAQHVTTSFGPAFSELTQHNPATDKHIILSNPDTKSFTFYLPHFQTDLNHRTGFQSPFPHCPELHNLLALVSTSNSRSSTAYLPVY